MSRTKKGTSAPLIYDGAQRLATHVIAQFRVVMLTRRGIRVARPGFDRHIYGVSQNKAVKGGRVDVGLFGITKAVSDRGRISVGDDLAVGPAGRVRRWSPRRKEACLGKALEPARGFGKVFAMLWLGVR